MFHAPFRGAMKQRRSPSPRAPATAAVVDACLRETITFKLAPSRLAALFEHAPIAGPALAVKHAGSVDVFLEAFNDAPRNAILVIDNEGLEDEGCIGDLTAIEAKHAGVQGAVIWGRHRDSAELRTLKFRVTSLGACPAGPNRKTLTRGSIGEARIGPAKVRSGEFTFMDTDGVVFVPADKAPQAIEAAHEIMERERKQAQRVNAGTSLREQFRFADYLKEREKDPKYTLRAHLRRLRAEIEV